MEYIISVVSPDDVKELSKIHKQMNIPIFLTVFAHGTAVQSMLDLLGIDSNERRIVIAVANSEKAEKLIKEIKRRLYIGVPGHGIVVSVPKRCFKRAVKRNLLKRRIREAYRLNKQLLPVSMPDGGTDILFIYSTKEVLDFSAVQEAVTSSLTAIAARVAARSAAAESNVVEISE